MKRAAAIFMIWVMIFVLAACFPSQENESTTEPTDTVEATATPETSALVQDVDQVSDPTNYQFAIVYGGVHPYFEPYEPGAKAAANDLGIPEPYVTSPQAWDQTEQNKVLDGVIARGATGIAMFPSDAVAGNEQITKMVDLGIPVVTLGGSPAEPSQAQFCFATDVGASVHWALRR